MDNSTRLQYLEVMGIDVWISRTRTDVESSLVLSNKSPKDLADNGSVQLTQTLEQQWSILKAEVAQCEKCDLFKTRNHVVFGSGNLQADLMFIGEAPGHNEDLEGLPFVGQAGKLLTEMIRAVGLARDEVYITNILKCRPPQNRDPKTEEINRCFGYLQQQINLVNPKVILAVGRVAAQTLLKTNQPMSKLRGEVHQLSGMPVVVVVYHPAYLLRSLLEKRKAWQDLQMVLNYMKKNKN